MPRRLPRRTTTFHGAALGCRAHLAVIPAFRVHTVSAVALCTSAAWHYCAVRQSPLLRWKTKGGEEKGRGVNGRGAGRRGAESEQREEEKEEDAENEGSTG